MPTSPAGATSVPVVDTATSSVGVTLAKYQGASAAVREVQEHLAGLSTLAALPQMDSLRRIALRNQKSLDALRRLTVLPEMDSLRQIARRNQEMMDRALGPSREIEATMRALNSSLAVSSAKMVESLSGFSGLADQIKSLTIGFQPVPIPEIAFSPRIAEAIQANLDGLLSPSGFLGPAVLDLPHVETSLAEFVDEAAESLSTELVGATSEPDRLRIFVGWWAGLPPWAQLVLAVILAWATWGISTELLSEKGMLPSLPDLEPED